MSNKSNETEKTNSRTGSCKLIFKNYYVENIEFKYNKEYKQGSGIPIEFEMASDIEFVSEDQVQVRLLLSIFDEAVVNNKPFEMKVAIVGIFSVKEYQIGDNTLLEQNTLSILFPFARAIVSTYTAGANVAPLILPPINVIEYMNEKQNLKYNKEIMK